MKKIAFTLAEVLMCLAIISIVIALGLKLARHNIDNAYKLYYYTSYEAVSSAISEQIAKDDNIKKAISKACDNITNSNSGGGVQCTLNDDNNGSGKRYTWYTIKVTIPYATGTKTYDILYLKDEGISSGAESAYNPKLDIFKIANNKRENFFMTFLNSFIPKAYAMLDEELEEEPEANAQTGNSTTASATLPPNTYLIPINPDDGVQIQDRKDILSFYVDDGMVGRVINGKYNKKTAYSASEAFCRARGGHGIVIDEKMYLDCSINDIGDESTMGIVKPIKPGLLKD